MRTHSVVGCFGLCGTLLWALQPESAGAQDPNALRVYFGTYTGGKSQGIYVAQFDPDTGRLSAPELAGAVASPSFLAVHPDRRFLYAVNEMGSFGGKKSGAASSFAVDAKTGHLTLLNQQPSGGDGPCHLAVDRTGTYLLVANYGGGSCTALPIAMDGRLGEATSFIQHHGSSVNKSRQEGPHAHGIYVDARNRFAFVPDLGLDKVMIYQFDAHKGSLLANGPPFASIAPGSGPRHFAFDPAGKHAYVINEMLCTITAFAYDASKGQLQEMQTISTLPPGESVRPAYSTAEIFVHPSGKFLYGSNRGHNTLAVYTIDPTNGRLALVQHESTQGKTPRGFGIDPSGRYLVAANQDSDNAVVFQIDQTSGRLTPTGQSIAVGTPVCVVFWPPAR